jgi:hypothetical protein
MAMSRTTITALVLLFVVLICTGCGGGENGSVSSGGIDQINPIYDEIEDFGSKANRAEAELIEARLHRYLGARSAGEWAKACGYLSKPSRGLLKQVAAGSKRIDGRDCAAAMAALTKRLSSSEQAALSRVEAESVRIEGTHGYVLYKGSHGSRYATPMRREGERWAFSFLSPSLP